MQPFIAKTLAGLEPVLADELRELGATEVHLLKRAVAFRGDQRLLYRTNYELRTALRILVPVHTFSAHNERDFYDGIREVNWSKYVSPSGTIAIDAVAQGEVFRHSQYVGLLTKDAVVDQFRDRYQRRPNVDTRSPTLRVNVHVLGTQCDISLDATGGSLHRRNYRRDSVEAPLNEVLAAGMIRLSNWDGKTPFVDPMCGSGTLAIEAALLALRRPPQCMRPEFGFFKWPDFDASLWQRVREVADNQDLRTLDFPIVAADQDTHACQATMTNVRAAGLHKIIQTQHQAFERLSPPALPGILMTNPPYDERLQMANITAFYRGIGDRLKQAWPDWEAWLISSNREALKQVGLRPSTRITLFNGALECSFQKFALYTGSQRKQEQRG